MEFLKMGSVYTGNILLTTKAPATPQPLTDWPLTDSLSSPIFF
jgi:hypothetical protein